jgi:hypothetical protein
LVQTKVIYASEQTNQFNTFVLQFYVSLMANLDEYSKKISNYRYS